MVRIDVSTLIARPVPEVWDFFIDFTNSSHWTRSGSELRKTSEGPFGVGTTVESVKPMFGREIRSQRLVATRYEPPYLVSFKAVVPVIGDLIGGFTLESVDGGTRLSRWAELNAGGIRGAIGSILAPIVRRANGDGAVEHQAPHRSADRLDARAGARAFDAGSDGGGTRRPLVAIRDRWISQSSWLASKESNLESPDPESGALPFGHSPVTVSMVAQRVAGSPGRIGGVGSGVD